MESPRRRERSVRTGRSHLALRKGPSTPFKECVNGSNASMRHRARTQSGTGECVLFFGSLPSHTSNSTMDHQAYLRRLRARIQHLDVALDRARDLRADHPIKRPIDALKEHAQKIEGAGDDWEKHRDDVEASLHHVQDEIEADETVLGDVAESVRDGAVELFRGEPSELVRRTEAVMRKLDERKS